MGCKVGIGNNDHFVVIGSYPGAANSHPPDHPGGSSYVDAIPDAEWLFDEQYQSGHPVGHDRLQAKAHTDAERPSQDRQRVQVYSGCLQPDHETNDIDRERHETRQNVTMLWVERGSFGNPLVEEFADPVGQCGEKPQTKPVSRAISRTAPKSTLGAKKWRTSDCSRIDYSTVRLCHAAPFEPLRAIVLAVGIFRMLPFDVWASREGGSGRAGSVRTRAGGSEKSHAGTGEPPRRLPRKLGDCSACKSRLTILCAHPAFVSSLLLDASNGNRYNTPHRFRPAILFAFQRGVTDRRFSSRSASSLLKSLH